MTAEQTRELEKQIKQTRSARRAMQRYDNAKRQLKEEEKKKREYERGRTLTGKILSEGWKLTKQVGKAVLKEAKKR